MSRWYPLAVVLTSLVLSGCPNQEGMMGPYWDIGGFPQAGYTYEGRIWVGIYDGRPGYPLVDESNLHLITWPEGDDVAVSLTGERVATNVESIDMAPTVELEPDRWYAIRWDSPEPLTLNRLVSFRLASAVRLDEDSFAWPFWSTSGPIPFSLGWDRTVARVIVAYSDQIEPGPEYEGTVTQGDTICRLDSFTISPTIEGDCASLDVGRPVRLHIGGLLSAGTGVELAALDRELMLAADGGVRLGNRLEWPAFEGVP